MTNMFFQLLDAVICSLNLEALHAGSIIDVFNHVYIDLKRDDVWLYDDPQSKWSDHWE